MITLFYVLGPINVCHKSMENNFVILFFVFLEALHSLHVRNNYFDHDFHLSKDLIHFTNYSVCFPIHQPSDILWLHIDLKPVWYFHFVKNICCSLLSWNNNARRGIHTEFISTELLYCVPLITGWFPQKTVCQVVYRVHCTGYLLS